MGINWISGESNLERKNCIFNSFNFATARQVELHYSDSEKKDAISLKTRRKSALFAIRVKTKQSLVSEIENSGKLL